jgi:hypothetical protein
MPIVNEGIQFEGFWSGADRLPGDAQAGLGALDLQVGQVSGAAYFQSDFTP